MPVDGAMTGTACETIVIVRVAAWLVRVVGSVAKNSPWCRQVPQVRFQLPGPPS